MQPALMTFQQFANGLIAKSCKVVDLYNKSTLNDVLIGGVDGSTSYSLQHSLPPHPLADLGDISFQAYSVLSIQNGTRNVSYKTKSTTLQTHTKRSLGTALWRTTRTQGQRLHQLSIRVKGLGYISYGISTHNVHKR